MNKFLIIARHEYLINLKKRSFLFAAFGIPIFIIIIWAIVFAVADSQG